MNDIIEKNITILKGATKIIEIAKLDDQGYNVDLSDWVGESHVREFPEAVDFFEFNVNWDDGKFVLTMSAETTHEIPYSQGYWDFFLRNPLGERVKIAQGRVLVEGDVTR